MKVLMMVKKNARDYILLLKNSLSRRNIKVIFPEKIHEFFPFFRNVLSSNCRNLHVHWIHPYSGSERKNIFSNIKKMFIFITDVLIVKYVLKTQIIWTVHNLYAHECYNFKIAKFERQFFSSNVNGIICHCSQAKRLIQKNYRISQKKIHVIPIGNYINYYRNDVSKENARKLLSLKNDDFVFCNFGRIRPYKGIDTLIKTFKVFIKSDKNKNAKLIIVGQPLSNEIKSLLIDLSKNINNIILKFEIIPDEDVQIFMNASDIIVAPYKKLLTSAIIINALTFSKPIIAPKIGCVIGTLDKKGAFLYNPQKKDGLLNALQKAMENKDNLSKMGKYNFELTEKLDWKVIGKETIKIYDKYFKY